MATKALIEHQPDPWERLSHEPEKSHEMFIAYRDMEDRSLPRIAKELNRELSSVEGLAVDFNWMSRVAAWDNEVARKKRAAEAKDIEAMAKRQAKMGETFQTKAFRRIEHMTEEEAARLPLFLAMKMVAQGMQMERTARGLDDGGGGGPSVAVNVNQQTSIADQVKFGSAAPLAKYLRDNPDKVGEVVDLLHRLRDVVGSDAPIDVTPLLAEPEE
jgi:hypothetical protein